MADQGDLNFNIAISTQKRNENTQNQSNVVNQPNNNQPQAENKVEAGITSIIKNAAHPTLCIIVLCFKLGALAAFLLLDWFARESISYLAVIIIGSADFWVTKNVSGRILVGLRWWNEVKEDGTEVWIFESKNEKKEHGGDATIFWYPLYISAGVWCGLFIWDLIKLNWTWMMVAFLMFVFSATNLYGYIKCSKEQQSNILKFGAKTVMKAAEKGANIAKDQV